MVIESSLSLFPLDAVLVMRFLWRILWLRESSFLLVLSKEGKSSLFLLIFATGKADGMTDKVVLTVKKGCLIRKEGRERDEIPDHSILKRMKGVHEPEYGLFSDLTLNLCQVMTPCLFHPSFTTRLLRRKEWLVCQVNHICTSSYVKAIENHRNFLSFFLKDNFFFKSCRHHLPTRVQRMDITFVDNFALLVEFPFSCLARVV